MTYRRRQGLVTVGIVSLILTFAFNLHAEPPKISPTNADPSFKGKVLLLYIRSHLGQGAIIENARTKRIGDITFLVGEGVYPEEGKDWYNGRTIWIAVTEIVQIFEYSNREAMLKAKQKRPDD
jgi:hypothetical protein